MRGAAGRDRVRTWLQAWPLTLRGTAAIAVAIAAFVLAHELAVAELLYVAVLLVAVTGAAAATLYLVSRTERISRAFTPDVVAAGDEVTVRVRVEIRSPVPTAQGRWRDRLDPALTGDAAGTLPAPTGTTALRPGDDRAADLLYRVRATRRGVRPVGPLSVTATDPFGFARRRQTLGAQTLLTVTPPVVELGPLSQLPGEAGGSLHSETNELGQGADNLIPRTYVPGDSMRRIHWRASAHRDELMVRQEEQESTPEAVVVFDRSRRRYGTAATTPGDDAAFETAVSALVSTVARLVREGYRVSVVDADGLALAEPLDGGDAGGVDDLVVAAATLTAHGEATADDLLAVFASANTGPLVLVTGTLDEHDGRVLPALAHHSSLPVLLAVDADPESVRRLSASGWHAASVPASGDVSHAWGVALEHGRLAGAPR